MKELDLQKKCAKWAKNNKIMSYSTQFPPRGTPDALFFVPGTDGKPVIIEFKTEDGRIQPLQKAVHKKYEKAGYTVYLVRSFKQFQEVMENVRSMG